MAYTWKEERPYIYEWNGKWYNSLEEMALEIDVSPATASWRHRKGYRSDADLHRSHRTATPVTIDGVEYPTVKKAHQETGLTMYKIKQIRDRKA
jgi:hypothetical protein